MTGRAVASWRHSPLRTQLIALRRAKGLSVRAVARLLGISAASVGAYERGDRTPKAPTLAAMFALYGQELVAIPAGTSPQLRDVAADAAATLRKVADRLDRPAPDWQAAA